MQKPEYSSYAEWYSDGPFAGYIRASGFAGKAMSVIEATQPDGDLSDPPISDLVLIRMLASDVPCVIDLGAGSFSAVQQYDDFILVAPDTASDIQMHAKHSVQLFSLPASNALSLLGDERPAGLDFGRLHGGPFRSELLSALCQRLADAACQRSPASRLFIDGASMVLLGELDLLAGADRVVRRRSDVRDWRVRRTIEQLDAHLGEDHCLAGLAASVGLSVSRYNAVFRAETGLSPHAWVVNRKIERACKMMRNHSISITEVALELGFSSSQHFATTFRAHQGVTPSEWRRQRSC